MKRRALIVLTLGLIATLSMPIGAYLKLGAKIGTRTVTLKWSSHERRNR